MRYLALLFIIILSSNFCLSQEEKKLRKTRLIIGISPNIDNTNAYAGSLSTDFALHLFSSYSAGVSIWQSSLFTNHAEIFATGLQLCLLTNAAGSQDFVKQKNDKRAALNGIQIALLANRVHGYGTGIQLSSFNKVSEYFEGAQMGIGNNVQAYLSGIQLALLYNYTKGSYTGMQWSGLFNYSGGQSMGVQFGLFNYVQSGGFGRKGFFNRDHMQVGLVNMAHKNTGYQIGLINIASESEAIPLGLLNLSAPSAYVNIESDELANTRLIIATGSRFFLNRISAGYNFLFDRNFNWTYSYGIEFFRSVLVKNYYRKHAWITDLIYIQLSDRTFREGKFAIKSGYSYTFDFHKRMPAVVLGLNANLGFFNNHEINGILSLEDSLVSGISFWPGWTAGINL